MLRSIHELTRHRIEAKDGDLGRAEDFLFDDRTWETRFLVMDTGTWLPKRQVLISPQAIQGADAIEDRIEVDLTKAQIEGSPEIQSNQPVSMQKEKALSDYFGWNPLWSAPEMTAVPVVTPSRDDNRSDGDSHLRSAETLRRYGIEAKDGSIGHVDDFIVDTDNWRIRYLIVATRNWLPGKKVMISPDWVGDIDWNEERVQVDMTRDSIRNGPEYDPTRPINRALEVRLYDFHGRPYYWQQATANSESQETQEASL